VKFGKIMMNGIFKENPTFRLLIGMCTTLDVTTAAINGLGMGLSTAAVLIGSNAVIALLKDVIPSKIRIPAFVVVIASFVTILGMLLKAYVPALDKSLGLFIPLIVVNCIILARAESFASKNGVISSIADGLGMGLGFTLALTILASIRELLGAGSIFAISIMGSAYEPAIIMILPPGAFLTLGLLLGLINKLTEKTQ
jgi:electron transport complex protein RnfE